MALNRRDVWGDLVYALDELERPALDIHSRLRDAADLDAQSEYEALSRLFQIGLLSIAYPRARDRADTRNAHEAIEKGLKAILIDQGRSSEKVKCRGHHLHLLLADIQQNGPAAFSELERCFNITMGFLERVTLFQQNTNIVDCFR